MKFRWILQHRKCWPVSVMCRVLAVTRSGYYGWSRRGPGRRQAAEQKLAARIRVVHAASRGIYGSPRVHQELLAQGVQVCQNTVAKVMKRQGLRSRICKRYIPRTTDSNHRHPVVGNRLERDFAASEINRKWACDITYVPTDQGWLYLAVVMDLCSRRIVGWSMADHLRAQLATDALQMALGQRRPGQLLHHSDRGVQYACGDYRAVLERYQITCSMSRAGNCYDNAAVESFFGSFKSEWMYHEHYATHEQAKRSIFEYIEVFYYRQRRHSTLGYVSPVEYEAKLN